MKIKHKLTCLKINQAGNLNKEANDELLLAIESKI
jgi:hypothetical protein